MSRRLARPYGTSISATRAVSLVFMLAVIYLLYDRFRDPATWKWLAHDVPEAQTDPKTAPAPTKPFKNARLCIAEKISIPGLVAAFG